MNKQLGPGCELDLLVAEKVMGEFVQTHTQHDGSEKFCQQCSNDFPKYSTDIAAAWEVVEKMKEEFYFNLHLNRQGNYEARFQGSILAKEEIMGAAYSESAPHAICKAALAAKGVEI